MSLHQLCTLRGHLNSISCIENVNYTSQSTIITGDENGWIIWWNLNKRVPMGVWKGHDKTILTIKQIDNVRVLTHSKDCEIKIWNLSSVKFNSGYPDSKYNDLNYLQSSEDDIRRLLDDFPLPKFNSIPVNALNFCNVEYCQGLLITPASRDSENFDIYKVTYSDDNNEDFNLSRIVENFNSHKAYLKTFNILEEINTDEKRSGFGIIMKIKFITPEIFYLGYESGHIVQFHIDIPQANVITSNNNKTLINQSAKVSLTYCNGFHNPNPILSIEIRDMNQLVVGSAAKKVSVHQIHYGNTIDTSEPTAENLKYKGVQALQFTSNLAVVGFWNGIIKGFTSNFDNLLFAYENKLPQLSCLTSNQSNSEDKIETNIKLTNLKIMEPTMTTTANSYKLKALQRRAITNKLTIISCYNDGNIILFTWND